LKLGAETQTCIDQLLSLFSSFISCKKGMGELQIELDLEIWVQQKDGLGLMDRIGGTPPSDRMPAASLIDESAWKAGS
jgi:hypothetical protein